MSDLIDRQAAINDIKAVYEWHDTVTEDRILDHLYRLPSVKPEVTRCKHCKNWDRNTLRHESNDFHEWDEAECLMLAERDSYHEINRYMAADDFCSYADKIGESDERMGNSTDSIGD